MNRIVFALTHESANALLRRIFGGIPIQERRRITSVLGAVTEKALPTAVRPFMFGGKIVHELYFDPEKMRFFVRREKIGAIVSAFIIASLTRESEPRTETGIALSDQTLMDHTSLIVRHAKLWKFGDEVSAFLRRLKVLEDEWRQSVLVRQQCLSR